jgi:predicted nuclease of predicted toxin-antitoxin system
VKLLLDQGLPRGAADGLRQLGFEAVHASELGLATASDSDLLERALREQRTVVTLDADFHALLARSNATGPSVVRVRIEGLRAAPLVVLLRQTLALCEADLLTGAMVTVDEQGIRVRALPVVR